METRLLIPISAAAIFHAAILFSGKSNHTVATGPAQTRVAPFPPDTLRMEPPEPVDSSTGASQGSSEARPVSEEPPMMDRTGMNFTVRPSPPSSHAVMTTIPIEPFGHIQGSESGVGLGSPEFRVGDLDNPPRIRSQVAPVYPSEAKNSGTTGEVTVEFIVDERGRVFDPRIVRSSDFRFESTTLQAVARWKFEPGKVNGRAVRFRMVAPVVFSLER